MCLWRNCCARGTQLRYGHLNNTREDRDSSEAVMRRPTDSPCAVLATTNEQRDTTMRPNIQLGYVLKMGTDIGFKVARA